MRASTAAMPSIENSDRREGRPVYGLRVQHALDGAVGPVGRDRERVGGVVQAEPMGDQRGRELGVCGEEFDRRVELAFTVRLAIDERRYQRELAHLRLEQRD